MHKKRKTGDRIAACLEIGPLSPHFLRNRRYRKFPGRATAVAENNRFRIIRCIPRQMIAPLRSIADERQRPMPQRAQQGWIS